MDRNRGVDSKHPGQSEARQGKILSWKRMEFGSFSDLALFLGDHETLLPEGPMEGRILYAWVSPYASEIHGVNRIMIEDVRERAEKRYHSQWNDV
jgi:hypothetical protein